MYVLLTMFLLAAWPAEALDYPTNIAYTISLDAQVSDVDPDIAVAIATVESGLNPKAIGKLGEVGVFQLRPEFHDVRKGDTHHNIAVGVAYLAEMKRSCAKFKDAWFVCYNYGPHNKLKRPRQTAYYKRVMQALNEIKSKRHVAGN